MKNRSLKASFLFGTTMLLVMLFSTVSTMAQATTGILRGSVVDNAGSLIAGASVIVKNEATGVEETTITNSEGVFEIQSLQPGSYSVSIEAKGFKRSVKTGFPVRVGIVNPFDSALEVGAETQTVTVTASADETLQSEQSQISTTFDARKVQDLPSNGAGGGIDTLALLSPGVIANRIGGTNTNGTGLSVNGNRGRSNNFQIDGADNNDLSVGGPALFVDFQDSVQEFQIVTNNFDARYGRNQGAVVNIVTKGGGNDFHGSAFFHYQDAKALNSLDNILRASGKKENDTNLYKVFGGTIGGPVYLPKFGEGGRSVISGKDRLFFFFAYQGIRNPAQSTGSSTSLAILPSDLGRLQSTFPTNPVINAITTYSPFAIPGAQVSTFATGTTINAKFNLAPPAGCPKALAVSAAVPTGCGTYTTFLNPATGQPFLTGGPYDVVNFGTAAAPVLFQAAQYQRTIPTSYNENYYSIRFDSKITDKDNATFRYLKQKSASLNGLVGPSSGFNGDIPAGSTNFGGNYTHVFSSSKVNDFRAFYQRIGVEFGGGCDVSTPGCIPGPLQIGSALANISFGAFGITKTNALTTLGPATNLPQGRTGKVYQAADNFSLLIGKHSLTLGAEFKHLNTVSPFLPNYNGVYSFNSVTRVLNNAPNAVSITLGDPTLAFTENDQYYFVQDDYKIRPNLTLNLGARYEYTGQPINQLNDISVARESNPSTAFFNPSVPLANRTVPRVPADKNNIAPRLGFAYTPNFLRGIFGDNKTVIRGGFSIAYDASFYNILLNVQNGAPFSAALTIPSSSLPSTGSPAPLPINPIGDVVRAAAAASGALPRGVLDPTFLAQTRVASDFRSPYSRQFSLGIQRQFGRNQIAEVRYVGTQGRDLFQNINGNFFVGPLVNGFTNQGISFPSFANLLPSGTVAQVCVDNPATLANEAACNNRQFRQGSLTTRANTSRSDYHSVQSRFNGNYFRNALSLGLAYTFSKTLDDSSEIFSSASIGSPNAQNPFCINKCEYSISGLDRPHAFSANFTFNVPFYREQRGFVGRILGGWQLNGTYILTSGAAYTPNNGIAGFLGLGKTYLTSGDRPFYGNPNADPRQVGISQVDAFLAFGYDVIDPNGFYSVNSLNTGDGTPVVVTPNDVKYIINGPGAAKIFGTPFGNVARNSERGPIFNNLNLSLFKNIRIFERLNIQLRGEAFNVLNHPNPGFGVASGGAYPVIDLTNAGAQGSAFAEFKDIEYANRVIQLGIRIIF